VTDLRLARFQELLVVNSDPAISVARDRSPCVPFVSCHQYIDVRSFSINIQNPSKLQIDLRQDKRRKRLRVNRGRHIGAPLGTTSHSARLDALRHVPPRSQISLLMADQTNRDRTTRCERARLVFTIEGAWSVASRYRPASIRDSITAFQATMASLCGISCGGAPLSISNNTSSKTTGSRGRPSPPAKCNSALTGALGTRSVA